MPPSLQASDDSGDRSVNGAIHFRTELEAHLDRLRLNTNCDCLSRKVAAPLCGCENVTQIDLMRGKLSREVDRQLVALEYDYIACLSTGGDGVEQHNSIGILDEREE